MTKLEFLHALRQLVADAQTEEALDFLSKYVREFQPSLATDATLLASRFQSLKTDFSIKGIVERADFDVTHQQIKAALLDIADRIEQAVPLSINRSSGRLLHKIPAKMPVGRETRCIVRIAYDDATLLRDMKKDENTIIEDVRIAEVMAVELVDFNETPAFQIRAATDAEQFVVSDDYTQWLFMVKPLRSGKFPLMLKVAVLETVNGRERKRDVVLEKEIDIFSENEEKTYAKGASKTENTEGSKPQAAASDFEDSNIRVNYVVTKDEEDRALPPPPKRFSLTTVASAFAAIAVALTGFFALKTGVFDMSSNKNSTVSTSPNGGNGRPNDGNKPTADTMTVDSQTVQNQRLTPHFEEPKVMAQTTPPRPTSVENDDEAATPAPKLPRKIQAIPKPQKTTTQNIAENNNKSKKSAVPTKPKPTLPPPPNKPEVYATRTDKPMVPAAYNVTYKVRLKLKGEMKQAEILVDGKVVKVLERNSRGVPQYIEFQSGRTTHSITFVRNGVSCTVENIVINGGDVEIEACSF